MNCIQDSTKFYWEQKPQQNNIIVPKCTNVHPCLGIIIVTKVKIPKNVCNKNQAHKAVQGSRIFLTDSDNDVLFD